MRPRPTLRQLAYLVAIAEHRHFGRAADSCLVTQSTLSAGLTELERLLGVTLVERTKRRVMVTPLGEEVAARARELLRRADEIVEVAEAAGEPLSGTLRLGVIPTIGPYLLPRLLPPLRAAFPSLRVYLREDLTARLIEQLQAGTLDVLLLALPYPVEGLETAVLAEDPFLVAMPPGHRLAARNAVRSADIADSELLLLEEGHCLRQHALAACRRADAGEGLQGTSLLTVAQMAASGLGVTLLPRLAIDADILRGTDLVTRPLADEAAPRQIGLAWRRSSPRKPEFILLAGFLKERLGKA